MSYNWFTIEPPTGPDDEFKLGARVVVKAGNDKEGMTGEVVLWGRDTTADVRYRDSQNPEDLVDAEGPVVRYDATGLLDFYPGQATTALEYSDSARYA